MQPFPMDDHYRTDVISGVGHSGLNSVLLLVLHTVCFVHLLGHWHCTTGPSGQRQPCWEGVISRVDHIVELLLLLMIISIYYLYIYIYHLHDNYHLIMLHMFYKLKNPQINDGYVMWISTH
jgi:hypothetical protein